MIEKVSIQAKAKQVTHHYEPKEIAVINDMSVKLAKFEGPLHGTSMMTPMNCF
ncbi:Uncharacterised protein [Listeria grayi]|uniref:Uncharacterized protein n=1 Tax=Listeria grayi TaxID=1641 RepID=A0A378MN18_LISGR|nr:hypothetical protein [Listeria grayi]STY45125.1 Uncharacterised protein [Listeria grayi]